jgi:hypothetical protein
MNSMLASRVESHWFDLGSCQTKDYRKRLKEKWNIAPEFTPFFVSLVLLNISVFFLCSVL